MNETTYLDDKTAALLRSALGLEGFIPEEGGGAKVAELLPESALCLYKEDEFVIQQGEESRDLYVVVDGLVTITQTMGTAGAQLAQLKPGEVFGEIALLRDGERVANAIAAKDSRIFRLAASDVKTLVAENPPLGERLMKLAEERTNQ